MRPGVRLVVLGRQGAGKGTQCVRLSHHFAVPHVSTGDMLRAAVRGKTDLGERAKGIIDDGRLIPDEMVMEMVDERLSQRDVMSRGFILDGCPRTIGQAEHLRASLLERPLELVVDLDVPRSMVLERLESRRTCVVCGTIYSTQNPPMLQWVCDNCHGDVVQRDDDTAEAIAKRLDLYDEETTPLLDFYREEGLLELIDGTGSPDEVFNRVLKAVAARRSG